MIKDKKLRAHLVFQGIFRTFLTGVTSLMILFLVSTCGLLPSEEGFYSYAGYISYNGNGNTSGTPPQDKNQYKAGDSVVVLANVYDLRKTLHAFRGWNTKADGTGKTYKPGDSFLMPLEKVTLYAVWNQEDSYSITYYANFQMFSYSDGSVPEDPQVYFKDDTVTVLGNPGNLTSSHYNSIFEYQLVGWNTSADGSGTTYLGGDTFIMGTQDVSLYGFWREPTYSVTYLADDKTSGTVPVDSNVYEYQALVTVLGNTGDLGKLGMTAGRWNTSVDGSGTFYLPGDTFTILTSDVSLYVFWGDPATSVSAGSEHTVFLTSNGSMWAMGDNSEGQLGDGDWTDKTVPIKVVDSGVASVSAGGFHTMFVKTDGSLWAMGLNLDGQLGDGTKNKRTTPVEILSNGVKAVSSGSYHTMILKTDGSLWATGRNYYGQLGDGTTSSKSSLVQILSEGVTMVSAGGSHTMFVKTDGSLWAMGNNSNGQLGDGTTSYKNSPVQILSTDVEAVSAGDSHTLVLKTDGSLWATGSNYKGRLGDGTTSYKNSPVQILSTGVEAVSAGGGHTLFLKTDGSLWGMGENLNGQLGDNTYTDRYLPVQIRPTGVAAISAGRRHSMIITTRGGLWATGSGTNGKLGNGSYYSESDRLIQPYP